MTTKKTKTTNKNVSAKQRQNSESRKRSLANLRPFTKGHSGNPAGRPKARTLSEAYRAMLGQPLPGDPTRTYADAIAETLCRDAVAGNVVAAKELADRTEGRPRQAIDFSVEERKRELVERAITELINETNCSRDEAVQTLGSLVPEVSQLIH